jgi:hypothetical protein
MAWRLDLERNLHLGAVGGHLAIVDHQIQFDDFGDAQVAQGLRSAFHSRSSGFLPGFRARADQFDDFVNALCHVFLLLNGL